MKYFKQSTAFIFILLLNFITYSQTYLSTHLTNWQLSLNISSDNKNFTRTMGGDPTATNDFNASIDILTAPPGMTYYAYLEIPKNPYYLQTDMRPWIAPYQTSIEWILQVVNSGGKTTTINWNNANLPAGGQFLMIGSTFSKDMRVDSGVSFSGDQKISIQYHPPTPDGWRLPLKITDGLFTYYRTLGGDPAATLDFDPQIDEVTAPPAFSYYAYFEIPGLPYYLSTNIYPWQAPFETPFIWTLKITNATGKSTETIWDPAQLPKTGIFTMEYETTSLNMQEQNKITVTGDMTIFIKYQFGKPAIEIMTPKTGDSLEYYTDYTITWKNINFSSNVSIYVAWDGINYKLLAENIVNTGSYIWKIQGSLKSSESVRIKIEEATNKLISAQTGLFWAGWYPVPLSLIASSPQKVGTEFWVDVRIDPDTRPIKKMRSFHGVITFATDYLSVPLPVAESIQPGEIWGGNIDYNNNRSWQTVDEPAGKIEFFHTIKNEFPYIDAIGIVARIKFISNIYTPDNKIVDFKITDAYGNSGRFIFTDDSTQVILCDPPKQVLIWPGDTNNDGAVNVADILPIGLYYGSQGFNRQNANTNWTAQYCFSWDQPEATFADATGNGVVDTLDIPAILKNYNQIHTVNTNQFANHNSQISSTTLATVIKPIVEFKAPDTLKVKIQLASVQNLFGLAFDLIAEGLKPVKIIKSKLLWKHLLNINWISILRSQISFGIVSRSGMSSFSQDGIIAEAAFWIDPKTPAGKQILVKFLNVQAIDPAGKKIEMIAESADFKTGIDDRNQMNGLQPTDFSLSQNFPNPFNPETTIQYQLPAENHVVLKIFDMLGKKIITLMDQKQPAGYYKISWNGCDSQGNKVPAAIYFYQLGTEKFNETRKMILLQ
ncbi:T9SS type A sorting domain-containing protein [candidate division KSB1 bacterium]|nr:T9SS type A sorting domain-containing protein [candidate division KSB1 bacterium]